MSAAVTTLRTAAREGDLVVTERFVSLQGEGPSLGQAAVFLRLGGCPLSCSWCDTAYTWDWSRYDPQAELSSLPVRVVADWILDQAPSLVVITGGEPLMQQPALLPLVRRLHRAGRRVECETSGTIAPRRELASLTSQFTVSPKLHGSGMPASRRMRPTVLATFRATRRAVFKFVITGEEDWQEATRLVTEHGLAPVWVMPEGTTPQAITQGTRWLAERASPRGWSVSTRLHILLWGDERGV